MTSICTAVSTSPNSAQAVDSVLSSIHAEDCEISLLFCSVRHDLARISSHISARWPRARIVGCTSAAEITPAGYLDGSITAIGFGRSRFHAAATRIDGLQDLALRDVARAVRVVRKSLSMSAGHLNPAHCFAILLVDGSAACEEKLAAALSTELGGIALVGGSAGNDWTVQPANSPLHPHVLHEGSFRRDCAVLLLVHTTLQWRALTHTHYRATSNKAVITAARPDHRLVLEINGTPASPTYAGLCGMVNRPTAGYDFSANPAMIRVGGKWFPRGIFEVLPDDSIRFACAIERGLVVSVGEPGDMLGSLQQAFRELQTQLGPPAVTIGFDCAARTVNMDRHGLRAPLSEVLKQNHVVGASTLGEQYNAMHMNNSFTALAIGHE